MMADLLYKDEVYSIIGAAMDVYNDLGPGFLENVYQEALEMEAEERKISFKAQHQIIVKYKNKPLKKHYLADLLCYEKIIVEIKATSNLTMREEGQLLNYLKATGIKVGVLINFGHYPSLEWKRLVLTKESPYPSQTRILLEDEPIYQTKISDD
jgi:GxxExxY protein